jgi:hypothetical protein
MMQNTYLDELPPVIKDNLSVAESAAVTHTDVEADIVRC